MKSIKQKIVMLLIKGIFILISLCFFQVPISCSIQKTVNLSTKQRNIDLYNSNDLIVLRHNKSFEEQIPTASNQIIDISYDYDLGNETVVLPANCILRFRGGKLKNGRLVGNNSIIEAGNYKVFHNIDISGTWNNDDCYIIWFSTDNLDKFTIIRSAFNIGRTIHFEENADYYVKVPSAINDIVNRRIIGNGATIRVEGNGTQTNLFYIDEESNKYSVQVEGLNITGIGHYVVNSGDRWMYNKETTPFLTSNVIGFHFVGRGDLYIKNCQFFNVLYGVRMDESENTSVNRSFYMDGCTSDDECIMPVMVHHVNRTTIKNCDLTCAKSTGLVHHLYLSDCINSILVDSCYLYGGTGDPLDIYHSHCKTQLIKNNTIQANEYSAIVLDDVDHDVNIENCSLSATGRGCLYVYKCRERVIGRNITFETPIIDETFGNYVIHSPYSEDLIRVQLDSCIINAYKLQSDVSSKLTLDIDNCQMRFNTGASISRPVSQVTYNIRNSHITCPNFTRYSTLFDIRNSESAVNLINTEIDRGGTVGDWLISVDVPYKLNIVDCVCSNVKSIINKMTGGAKTSSVNSRIVTKRIVE